MASAALRTALVLTLSFGFPSLTPLDAIARGSGGRTRTSPFLSSSSGKNDKSPAAHTRGSIQCLTRQRESHGKLNRNRGAVEEFKRTHPEPLRCKDCEVDHVVRLAKADGTIQEPAVAIAGAAPGQREAGSGAVGHAVMDTSLRSVLCGLYIPAVGGIPGCEQLAGTSDPP